MIISCDPPRHALLIHFGERRQPRPIQSLQADYHGAKVELAISQRASPPTLISVLFARHGFRLPFLQGADCAARDVTLQSGREEGVFFFYLRFSPRGSEEWEICPGVTALLKLPEGYDPQQGGFREVWQRPELQGLRVDLNQMDVKVDGSEFVFEMGADTLKDVPASLFIEW